MTPEDVLALAARIEDTLGPAIVVSKKEKGLIVSALQGLARFMAIPAAENELK